MRCCPADCLQNLQYKISKPAAQKYTSNVPLIITAEIRGIFLGCKIGNFVHNQKDSSAYIFISILSANQKLRICYGICLQTSVSNNRRQWCSYWPAEPTAAGLGMKGARLRSSEHCGAHSGCPVLVILLSFLFI